MPSRILTKQSKSTQRPEPATMTEQLKFCDSVLRELFDGEHADYAWPFYNPVDAELFDLVDYHEIVTEPMDLRTIKKKMDKLEYHTPGEFASDVRLIFTNCYKYHDPDHEIVAMAKKLEDVFEKKYAELPDEPSASGSSSGN